MTAKVAKSEVESLIAQISYLQKRERDVHNQLIEHENMRGKPCPEVAGGVICVKPSNENGLCSDTNHCGGNATTLHYVGSCNECGVKNWCNSFANLSPSALWSGKVRGSPLSEWGCDKVSGGTQALRNADNGAIFALEPATSACLGKSQSPFNGGCNHFCPGNAPFYRSDLGGCVTLAYSDINPPRAKPYPNPCEPNCLFKKNGGEARSKQLWKEWHNLTKERAGLFKSLIEIEHVLNYDISDMQTDLIDQIAVLKVAEEQLADIRNQFNKLERIENNSNRMALINTYYSKRTKAHIGVIKMIISIIVPLIALGIIAKKKWIKTKIAIGLATSIITIGAFFVLQRVWDLSMRSNMNYDEYNWAFDPNADDTTYEYERQHTPISDGIHSLASDLGVKCVGAACCSKDMIYDRNKGKCIEPQAQYE